MPFILSPELLDSHSTFELFLDTKSDINDILEDTLSVIKDLCKEKTEDMRGLLKEASLFRQFEILQKQTKEFSEGQKLHKTFFAEGILGQTYSFFEYLERNYKKTLHGLILKESVLLKCLGNILLFVRDKLEKNTYIFNNFFHSLERSLRAFSNEAMSDSLRLKVHRLKIIFEKVDVILKNIPAIISKVILRLRLALACQFFNDLQRKGIRFKSCKDAKELGELLSAHRSITHPELSERCERLGKYMQVETLLWYFETRHRAYCKRSKTITEFHPKVHRLGYYDQAQNPSIYLNNGLCLGGVRCWDTLFLEESSPRVPELVAEPNFSQHMNPWMDIRKLYHGQLNQKSFFLIKDSGDHLMFKVCSKAVALQKKPDSLGIGSEEGPEVKMSNEAYHLLIDALFLDMNHAFELYPGSTLAIVSFGQLVLGHAMGFRRHEVGKSVRHYFFDMNEGEFYAENSDVLKEWFKKYFFELAYDQMNFYGYQLSAIIAKKKIPYDLNSDFLSCIEKIGGMSKQAIEASITEKREKPVMLHLWRSRNRKSDERIEDEKSKKELIDLARFESDDEKESFENNKLILTTFERIKRKSEVDIMLALHASSDILNFLKETNSSPENMVECINRDLKLFEEIKVINPAYGDLEVNFLFDQAHVFLKFPSLGKKDEAILVLKKFCDKVDQMKKENFCDKEEYEKLKLLKDQIKRFVKSEKSEKEIDTVAVLEILQRADDDLSEAWKYFNIELYLLSCSMAQAINPQKVDDVALDKGKAIKPKKKKKKKKAFKLP